MLPFSNHRAKPLLPVLGVPNLWFHLHRFQNGYDRVVNVHALFEDTVQRVKALDPQLKLSDERKELLGSGGGYVQALDRFQQKSAFFGVNADILMAPDFSKLELTHQRLREKHQVVMTLAIKPGSVTASESYTEILFRDERMIGLGQKKTNVPFFSSYGVFEPEAFSGLTPGKPYDFVKDILMPWIDRGRVGIFQEDPFWMDIGSPDSWVQAHLSLWDLIESHDQRKQFFVNAMVSLQSSSLYEPFERRGDFFDYDYQSSELPRELLGKTGIRYQNKIHVCRT